MNIASPRSHRGFTLIETIAAMVILAIAAATIINMQSSLFKNQSGVTNLQVASRLQAECAEQVLGVALNQGYFQVLPTGSSGTFGTHQCDTLTAYGSNNLPTVTFTDPYTGTGCPAGQSCKLVIVTQDSLQPITLLLVGN